MARMLAWFMIVTGCVILGFNGYKWWGEINIAVKDPKMAMTIAEDWQETKEEPALANVESFDEPTLDTENQQPSEQDDPNHQTEETPSDSNKKTESKERTQDQEQKSESENENQANEQKPSQEGTHQQKPKKPSKPSDLTVGSNIGQFIIPKTGSYLTIVEGTDDESLKKGIGKYRGWGTVAPNQTGHVVLSGHRNTVLPNSVGDLKSGDKMYIKFKNKIYTYQIRKTWITHANDRTVIVPYDRPVLTVTTCYPFDYKGDAPDRFILQADLIRIQNNA